MRERGKRRSQIRRGELFYTHYNFIVSCVMLLLKLIINYLSTLVSLTATYYVTTFLDQHLKLYFDDTYM